jgi:hypothetical protein
MNKPIDHPQEFREKWQELKPGIVRVVQEVTSTLATVRATCRESVNVSTQRNCTSSEKVYVEQVEKLSLNRNCSDIL